jgi:cytoskeleton protein RodZ
MTEPARTEAASAAAGSGAAALEMTPGACLAQARVAHGLSVEGVAQQLKFSPRQIEALEADRYHELAGIAVVRGMVRGYARLVHLDAEPLLAALKDVVPVPDAGRIVARYHEPVPFSNASKRSNMVYLVFTLAVLAVAALVWVQWRQERPESEARMTFVAPATEPQTTVASAGALPSAPTGEATAPASPVGDAEVSAATPAGAQAGTAATDAHGASDSESSPRSDTPPDAPAGAETEATSRPMAEAATEAATEAAAPAATGSSETPVPSAAASAGGAAHRVRLEFLEDSWVEIRDADGKRLHAQLNAAGSEVSVEGKAPLSFVIGNAQFVRLSVDGRDFDLTPHTKVAVARFKLP